jgi:hypothetical protein
MTRAGSNLTDLGKTGANMLLVATLDAVPSVRARQGKPPRRPDKLHADTGTVRLIGDWRAESGPDEPPHATSGSRPLGKP